VHNYIHLHLSSEAEVSPGGVPAMVEEEPGFQEGAEVEKAGIVS